MAEQKLPEGWRVEVSEDEQQSWLCLTGPGGQGAAFAVDRGTVRAEVLQNLAVDMIDAAGVALPRFDCERHKTIGPCAHCDAEQVALGVKEDGRG